MSNTPTPKRSRKLVIISLLLALCFVFAVIGQFMRETSSPPTRNQPAAEIAAPTNTPAPTYDSPGLGLNQAAWEQTHTRTADSIFGATAGIYDDQYDILFAENGNIIRIEIQWSPTNPQTPDQVQTLAQTLIPLDSQLIETYSPDDRPATTVLLHHSPTLAQRLPPDSDWWFGSQPGNFIIQYTTTDGGVSRLIISTGNNP